MESFSWARFESCALAEWCGNFAESLYKAQQHYRNTQRCRCPTRQHARLSWPKCSAIVILFFVVQKSHVKRDIFCCGCLNVVSPSAMIALQMQSHVILQFKATLDVLQGFRRHLIWLIFGPDCRQRLAEVPTVQLFTAGAQLSCRTCAIYFLGITKSLRLKPCLVDHVRVRDGLRGECRLAAIA